MNEVSGSLEVLFVDGASVPVQHKHATRMIVLRDAAQSRRSGAVLHPG